MVSTTAVLEKYKAALGCSPAQLAGWSVATGVILGALFMAGCGGKSATAGSSSSTTPTASNNQVSLTPQAPQVALLSQIQFSASGAGSTQGVSWSVNGSAGGSALVGVISNTGLYTAPVTLPSPNTVTVTAASSANPSQTASTTVTIVNPAPVISSMTPSGAPLGSANTNVTVSGTGFTYGSVIEVGGITLNTLYWNPTSLTTTIPAPQLMAAANLPVVVISPQPGGGTSAPVAFNVSSGVFATANPQVALYAYGTTQTASVSVEFGTDTSYGTHTWAVNSPQGGGPVQILVAGMRANTTYHMRADVSNADGSQAVDQDRTFITGAPPASLVPQFTVTNPNGLTPSSGALMWDLTEEANSDQFDIVATDTAGNVIWYYNFDSPLLIPEPIKLLSNGHILLNMSSGNPTPGFVREIDLAGNTISEFDTAQVNNWLNAAGYNITVNALHHDVLPLPNGHLIVLLNHYVAFTNLPGHPGTTEVLGDALVDLDQNHNVTWFWDSFDHLDVNRHILGLPDWTHSNAIVYSPDDGNLLLSMRDQSWVIKIDYENGQGSGDILWRLGYQGDFTLTNGQNPDWFYAQHYPSIVSPNSTGTFSLIVFDDGDNRVMDSAGDICGSPGQVACYSRVPIFQLDESALTATLEWQDILSPVYTFWGGSAQQLANTDVVFGISAPSDDPTGGRYMEVTNASNPQVVLQIEVSNHNAYRAVLMPSLYPGVQW